MALDDVQQTAQAQFSRQSDRYGGTHILADVSDVTAVLDIISLPHRARILDVATGAGHTGLHLAAQGHDVTLSDVAEPMLEQARRRAMELGLKVETRQHPAEELPYSNGSFDLVTCRVAAHHFTSPARFVAETSRVLRDGGFFLLIDGSVHDDEAEAEEWIHAVEKLRDPSHHRMLTPRIWCELCAADGLAVRTSELHPFKQPDLEWYFETAATPPENRARVLELIATAPESARRLFRLGKENGKIVWWWQRLTLIAESRVTSHG